jgi:hypothetical protein
MAKQLSALARSAQRGYRKTLGGRAAWREGTFTLARALRSARKQLPSDRDFAGWLVKAGLRGLAKNDRAALITIGENVRKARAFFRARESISWRACAENIRGMVRIEVSQIGKPPEQNSFTIEYAARESAVLASTYDIERQERPPQLRLVSSDGATPVDLQQAANAVMSFLPSTMPVTSDALAAYWRRERINSRPSVEQIRHAAHWLWTLADALNHERRAEPTNPSDDSA